MKRQVHFFYLFSFIVTASVIFSCKKTEVISSSFNEEQVASKFLVLPPGTDPEVKRVAQRLEVLNKRHEFLGTIAKKDGYAIWDKVIYNVTESKKSSPGSANKDTLIYIPLVRENDKRVNAFIYAKLNGSISLQLHRAKDYKSYKAGNIDAATDNAERLALQIMMLDKKVFGYSKFKLLDDKLFAGSDNAKRSTPRVLKISNDEPSLAGRGFVPVAVTHCTTTEETLHCTNSGLCASGVCDRCYLCVTPGTTNCVTTIHYYFVSNDDDGPIPGGGDGGGGGGVNGGDTTTGTMVCNPNPLLDNGLPPCPKGNDTGWDPELTDTFPNNPCETVDSLMKIGLFKNTYQALRDSTVRNYERGVFFVNPFSSTPSLTNVYGLPNNLSIPTFPIINQVQGFVHNHYNDPNRLSVFSADDLDAMYQILKDGKITDTRTFTFGVVTDSTSYILMITNPAGFL